jgi:CubicO group peptidase (beta-lactamase class C family)
MRKLFRLVLDSAGCVLPARPQAGVETGLDPARLKLIPVRLRELVENQTIPGAVALVARHGEIASLDAVGWRDIEGGKPMTTDSIFQIMSMTKQFTGVAP